MARDLPKLIAKSSIIVGLAALVTGITLSTITHEKGYVEIGSAAIIVTSLFGGGYLEYRERVDKS